MRGGALPFLVWGTILLILYALNWVWEGRAVQVGTTAYALIAIYGSALALWLARREAIRRGPPPPRETPEALPQSSLSAVVAGLAVGATLFGIVWARFLVDAGIVVLVFALARL